MILGGARRRTPTKTSPGEIASGMAVVDEAAPMPGHTGSRPATPARCEKSDLPIGQCGDTCCRPDLVEKRFVPVQVDGTWTTATYPGTCGCGCWTKYAGGQGVEIVLAELEDSHTTWCLVEHTRRADSDLRDGC